MPTPGGLSNFAWVNNGKSVWWELTPDKNVATSKVVGNSYAAAGGIGGTFGDGSAATSTATWPCIAAPTVPPPVLAADEAAATDDEAAAETVAV